jgi:hypothetical protein
MNVLKSFLDLANQSITTVVILAACWIGFTTLANGATAGDWFIVIKGLAVLALVPSFAIVQIAVDLRDIKEYLRTSASKYTESIF